MIESSSAMRCGLSVQVGRSIGSRLDGVFSSMKLNSEMGRSLETQKASGRLSLMPGAKTMMSVTGATGFEPAISTLTGWHVNRYTTPPFGQKGIVTPLMMYVKTGILALFLSP